jgi:predicted nucleic acid-binding protein
MRLVVADTSPLNYLVLIGQVEILPALFEKIFVPQIVRNELRHDEAPESVRHWIAEPPEWLEIVPVGHESDDPDLQTWTTENALRSCSRSDWGLSFCSSMTVTV